MPEFSRGGAMSIVAHQDDDLLFMNPDILRSIEAGEANSTVFVTAGDAGAERAYWEGRELGAKAAYANMAGSELWIDEKVTLTSGENSFQIASSYLADHPGIRLYFMRLPDGGGLLDAGDEQQLARLTEGLIATVEAKDGSASYARDDVVNVLSGLMDLHAPVLFRMQVHEGETAAAEHTDHIHVAELSAEALRAYSGGVVEVRHYVHYDSRQMPENLTGQEAARALEVMEAYAQFDASVRTPDGALREPYTSWTARQYVDDSYHLDTDADDLPEPEPEPLWPGAGDWAYSLSGADAFLYQINPLDGSVMPKGWFEPSLDDAWDAGEDHVYDVTRIAVSAADGQALSQDLAFRTVSDGIQETVFEGPTQLHLPEGEDPPVTDEEGDAEGDQTGAEDSEDPPGTEDGSTGGDGDAPQEPQPDGDTGGGDPDDGPPSDLPEGTVFALGGPDAFLFEIDAATGDVSPIGWYAPSLTDAWDRNEDFVHELTRISTDRDGNVTEEPMRLQTVAEGVLELLGGDVSAGDTGRDTGEETPTVPPEDPEPDLPPVSGGGELGEGGQMAGVAYGLSGPDAQLFDIDVTSGVIQTKPWFTPSLDDAWDRNEDFVYEVTRYAVFADGSEASSEDLRFATLAAGVLQPLPSPTDVMALMTSAPAELDPTPDETLDETDLDLAL